MTAEQIAELKQALEDLKKAAANAASKETLNNINEKIAGIEKKIGEAEASAKKAAEESKKESEEMRKDFTQLKKQFLSRGSLGGRVRRPGMITDDAAKALGAHIILGFARRGAFQGGYVDSLVKAAEEHLSSLGLEFKAAATTTEIPLPTEFTQELKELQAEYGVARAQMSPYPIGRGTSKPARLGTQDDFTFPIAISAAFTEKQARLGNASLESHKGGGILRLPRELDEQAIIPLGAMLARYAARKFGKAEDTVGFLGDGTATYDSISGVCKIANGNNNEVLLGATKTAPSDSTLEDWRNMRSLVASPVLATGKYYAHPTWERRFRAFKTQADPFIYIQNGPGGQATLDGYPIVWTEILAPYSTSASASSYIGVFGDLMYWWFGEHGSPRTDFSTDVFFTTDELAVRWLEEIDFDYADSDCAAALRLAAG